MADIARLLSHAALFRLRFEGKTYGIHVNYLTDHRDIDELTGNARWRYTPCKVEKINNINM